jgi:hypothetical protein
VSKTVPARRVIELARLGQREFGENKIQEAVPKILEVAETVPPGRISWRFVGHLQRNKVKSAIERFDGLDAVDSVRLLDALEREAARAERTVPVLLQFNCSGEETKSGFDPGDWEEAARGARNCPHLRIEGLMTIARPSDDPERARPDFAALRELRDRLQDRLSRALPELSMGMSDDLEVAIDEGSTSVRVGTALFGPREGTAE